MLSALLCAALQAAAPQAETKWQTKYSDALKLAQKEGKPMVIDAGRKG